MLKRNGRDGSDLPEPWAPVQIGVHIAKTKKFNEMMGFLLL
jgi:hypothetical protein